MRLSERFHKQPVTISVGASLADAAVLMDREVVGAVVVVDDGRPGGIVTDRDIAGRGVARRLPSDARIDAVMSTDLVTLPPEADTAEAIAIFDQLPFRRLPIVENDRVVGMITVDDLVVNAMADVGRLLHPVLGQVLFGHPEPLAPVPWGPVPAAG